MKKKIAIIGSGISGMSAAWALLHSQSSSEIQVTVYESRSRLGGHTATVQVQYPKSPKPLYVDTGFIVFNKLNYPNLVNIFQKLGIKTLPTEMSFSVTTPKFQWSSTHPTNLLNPKRWRMVWDIIRFNFLATEFVTTAEFQIAQARQQLAKALKKSPVVSKSVSKIPEIARRFHSVSVGRFLDLWGFCESFKELYFFPMCACVWSCPNKTLLEYPALHMFNFLHNHKLLSLFSRPTWRTVQGGSISYLQSIVDSFDGKNIDIKTNCSVVAIKRPKQAISLPIGPHSNMDHSANNGVKEIHIVDSTGSTNVFDHVIIACHAPEALECLGNDATQIEKNMLNCFPYQTSLVVLHRDTSLLPKNRNLWACWNYFGQGNQNQDTECSYYMNALQKFLPEEFPLIVTTNPRKIDQKKVFKSFNYSHPLFVSTFQTGLDYLQRTQGIDNTWFAGAWQGHGFHEDGCVSGLRVAESVLKKINGREGDSYTMPFQVVDNQFVRARIDTSVFSKFCGAILFGRWFNGLILGVTASVTISAYIMGYFS